MSGYDWSCFDLHLFLRAPIESVYERWSTSRGMESFFVRRMRYHDRAGRDRAPTEGAVAGDAYDLEFLHPFRLEGRVLEANPPAVFAFSFPDVMQVRVTLRPEDDGTHLHLHQSSIPDDPEGRVGPHMNCRSCWIYFLMTLKSQLEHGVDLRDPDRPTPDAPISVYFHALTSAGEG